MKLLKDSLGLWLVLVVLAATLPILCVIVFAGMEHRQVELDHAETGALRLTQALADEQEATTTGIWQLLSALALFPEVKDKNIAACDKAFADLVSRNSSLANVALLDTNGNVLASGLPFRPNTSYAGLRHVEEAKRTLTFAAGEYQVGRVSRIPVMAYALPVLNDQGELTAILTCSLDLKRYSALFDRAILPPDSVFIIADHAGTRLMVHPENTHTPAGFRIAAPLWERYLGSDVEGLNKHSGSDAIMRYYAFRKVSLSPGQPAYMTMFVGVPEAFALNRADRVTRRSLFLGSLAMTFSLLLAFLLSRHGILAKMDRLAEAARRIGAGDLDARAGPKVGGGAFGQVAKAFDDMAQALQIRQRELARAEARARDANTSLQDIIDSMPSAIFGVDDDCRITLVNRVAERSVGQKAPMVRGRDMGQVCLNLAGLRERTLQALRGNDPVRLSGLRDQTEEGCKILDVLIYPLTGDERPGAVIRIDDVTQRERMAELMVQTEKMMSVGGLAAGMAHEINNPLGGIMQSAQVLVRRLMEDSPARRRAADEAGCDPRALERFLTLRDVPELLQGIRESGARAGAIVSNMLEFSRGNDARRSSVEMHLLLDKAAELAASDYDLKKMYDFKKIRIVREYEDAVPPVVCSRTEIEQVFLNLLKNAAQALWTGRDQEREPVITLRTAREERHVRVEVEDNGPGMEENVRRRVFEPFFTTKEPGQGTGLGLSVAFFLVTTHHGGSLEVTSAPGRGARFVLRLPLSPKTA
ncbi:hypothetical protein JCM15519_31400 [Fundidesulfovibrio butyratiphilus]